MVRRPTKVPQDTNRVGPEVTDWVVSEHQPGWCSNYIIHYKALPHVWPYIYVDAVPAYPYDTPAYTDAVLAYSFIPLTSMPATAWLALIDSLLAVCVLVLVTGISRATVGVLFARFFRLVTRTFAGFSIHILSVRSLHLIGGNLGLRFRDYS